MKPAGNQVLRRTASPVDPYYRQSGTEYAEIVPDLPPGDYTIVAALEVIAFSECSGEAFGQFVETYGQCHPIAITLNEYTGPILRVSPQPPSHDFGQCYRTGPVEWAFNIWNGGAGTLSWTVTDDSAWISVGPSAGSSTGPAVHTRVIVDTNQLGAGAHTGHINISSNAGQSQGVINIVILMPPPVADAGGPYSGLPCRPISFDASGSYDLDGSITGYRWDWNADGVWDTDWLSTPTVSHTFDGPYQGSVLLQVRDNDGQTTTTSVSVSIPWPVVRPDGTGDYATIQAAIDDAADCPGYVIQLSNGTFRGAGNRDIDFYGRAITVRASNPSYPEYYIIDCEASGRGFWFHHSEGHTSTLSGLTVANGLAPEGGAMLCEGASPTVVNCRLDSNHATTRGGAVSCVDAAPAFRNCTINGSFAPQGAGLYFTGGAPILAFCTITGNHAAESGGATYCAPGSAPTIASCELGANEAVVAGGAIYCASGAAPVLVNDVIHNQSAGTGAGIFSEAGALPYVVNDTIVHNVATVAGGGACGADAGLRIRNSILWENEAPVDTQIHGADADVQYSDVQGGYRGAGNLDADPGFAGPGWPWSLPYEFSPAGPCSPCVDSGDNDALPPDSADLDEDGDVTEAVPYDCRWGGPRVGDLPGAPDTGHGVPPIVDMGAYEYVQRCVVWCCGDLNWDGVITFADVDLFVLAVFDPDAYEAQYPDPPPSGFSNSANLDDDCRVDFFDIDPFVALLGTTCAKGQRAVVQEPVMRSSQGVRFFFDGVGTDEEQGPRPAVPLSFGNPQVHGDGRLYIYGLFLGAGQTWEGISFDIAVTGQARITAYRFYNHVVSGYPRWAGMLNESGAGAVSLAGDAGMMAPGGLGMTNGYSCRYDTHFKKSTQDGGSPFGTTLLGWVDLEHTGEPGTAEVRLGVGRWGIVQWYHALPADQISFGFGDGPLLGNDFGGQSSAPDAYVCPRADLDLDCDVDFADFNALGSCLRGPAQNAPTGCGAADLDADGDVDLVDFGKLQTSFTGP